MRRVALRIGTRIGVPQIRHAITNSYGQITDEDRRWWKIHVEAHPDVSLGTFTAFLDNCDDHAQKRLIERDIWTIEQVSAMTEDEVENLKYREGCLKMDIIWEHARAIAPELRKREFGTIGTESEIEAKLLEVRKKRELERRKQEILQKRAVEVTDRENRIKLMKDEIQRKRDELRRKQLERQKEREKAGSQPVSTMSVAEAMETIARNTTK
uniref:Uncharacterized protein n=1 Tax=Paramoeba aestuarina TaxID=180227 RepID=A0A7S4NL18_9EUKA|mmetsp:Transcript_18128/g.28385  ORF Transcript_18128/g.28385 Transcript_18128/m.28385 type:complete len:212 (+) Transcript_18128:44-679(+)